MDKEEFERAIVEAWGEYAMSGGRPFGGSEYFDDRHHEFVVVDMCEDMVIVSNSFATAAEAIAFATEVRDANRERGVPPEGTGKGSPAGI